MKTTGKQSPTCNSRVLLGTLLVIFAILLLFRNFDILPQAWHSYVFSWQTLLAIVGLTLTVPKNTRVTGIVMATIGILLLLAKIYAFPVSFQKLFWPAVILIIGILIIINNRKQILIRKDSQANSKDDYVDDVAIFGGSEIRFTTENFLGGRITNIFGGSTIDLSEARLASGSSNLNILCIFGGSKLIVPTDWKLRVETVSIFGGVSDKRKQNVSSNNTGNNSNELVITGITLFGGCEIKSF
jgi:predicted membrane protein